MAKGRVEIHEELCKGCSLCIPACPKGVLAIAMDRLNAKGYHPAELIDPEGDCTGCALCAVICPDIVITVLREVVDRPRRRRAAQGVPL